jgi:hypothetical protein
LEQVGKIKDVREGKQSAFRGYLDVSGSLDAFLPEVLIPMRIIRNDAWLATGQNLNDWPRQFMRFPIGDSVAVDHVICASGPEQSQEVHQLTFCRQIPAATGRSRRADCGRSPDSIYTFSSILMMK